MRQRSVWRVNVPQTCPLQRPHAFHLVCLACLHSPALYDGKHSAVCLGVPQLVNIEPLSRSPSPATLAPCGPHCSPPFEKKNKPSAPVRLNLSDLYFSPSACREARARSDAARCDGCPCGTARMNGRLFNLGLKRRFGRMGQKEERKGLTSGCISPAEGLNANTKG